VLVANVMCTLYRGCDRVQEHDKSLCKKELDITRSCAHCMGDVSGYDRAVGDAVCGTSLHSSDTTWLLQTPNPPLPRVDSLTIQRH